MDVSVISTYMKS